MATMMTTMTTVAAAEAELADAGHGLAGAGLGAEIEMTTISSPVVAMTTNGGDR